MIGRPRPGTLPGYKTLAIYVAVIWLLAGPEITIAKLSGGSLRIADLILGMSGLSYFLNGTLARGYKRDCIDVCLWTFTGIAVVSSVVASFRGFVGLSASLLFALRPLEYWVIRPLVAQLGRDGRSLRVPLRVATVVGLGFSVAQTVGIHIGSSDAAYSRAAGATGGPYAAAAIAAGLALYWLSKSDWLFSLLAFGSLILSQSRSTAVALILVVLVFRWARRKRRRSLRMGVLGRRLVIVAIVTGLLAYGLGVAQGLPLVSRLQHTSLSTAYQQAGEIIANDPIVHSQAQYAAATYSPQRLAEAGALRDPSGTIRFMRWRTLMRAFGQQPSVWPLGFGPSFAFSAVDGYYVRVIIEDGLLGLFAFLLLLAVWVRRSVAMRCYALTNFLVVLLLTGLVIDIWVSLKPMLLLWALTELFLGRGGDGAQGGLRTSVGLRKQAGR